MQKRKRLTSWALGAALLAALAWSGAGWAFELPSSPGHSGAPGHDRAESAPDDKVSPQAEDPGREPGHESGHTMGSQDQSGTQSGPNLFGSSGGENAFGGYQQQNQASRPEALNQFWDHEAGDLAYLRQEDLAEGYTLNGAGHWVKQNTIINDPAGAQPWDAVQQTIEFNYECDHGWITTVYGDGVAKITEFDLVPAEVWIPAGGKYERMTWLDPSGEHLFTMETSFNPDSQAFETFRYLGVDKEVLDIYTPGQGNLVDQVESYCTVHHDLAGAVNPYDLSPFTNNPQSWRDFVQ